MKNNVAYLDELNVIYPVGNNAVIYNTESKSQRFLPIAEQNESITAMSLSENKKYLALGIRGERNASVVIFDIQTLRKRKTLVMSDVESKVRPLKPGIQLWNGRV